MKKATVNLEHEARMRAQTWCKAKKGRLRMILNMDNRMAYFHDKFGNVIKGRITDLGIMKKLFIAEAAEAIREEQKRRKANV